MLVGDDSASNIQHGSHACRGRGEGAEAGRGESGPARQHAHVLPSVVEGQFVDRGAAATLVITRKPTHPNGTWRPARGRSLMPFRFQVLTWTLDAAKAQE